MKYTVIFWGTTHFAKCMLQALWEHPQSAFDLKLVVGATFKKHDRRHKLLISPVEQYAREHNLFFQKPTNIKTLVPLISSIKPEFMLVCAYGQWIPRMLLQHTKIINLNIHPSLLPKYRGANPIRTAIQQEETVTGVSLIEVVDELDGGDLFWQQTCALDEHDNYVTLESRLIQLAKTMITEKLSFLLQYINRYRKAQNHQLATCSYKWNTSDLVINFHQSAQQISAFVRALSPDLGAITFWKNKVRYKWFQVAIGTTKDLDHAITYTPGTIVEINRRGFIVVCRQGFVQVLELQKAGKKKALASTYQNLTVGDWFGSYQN